MYFIWPHNLGKKSYLNPIETFQSNIIGTVNILEALRQIKKKVNVVIITSDKSYKNLELSRGYKEEDLLGGNDPIVHQKDLQNLLFNHILNLSFQKK